MIKISPSILSADFSALGRDAKLVENAGAQLLHIDVMDGHFAPNITIGTPVVKSLRACTKAKLDVHLMIDDPQKFVPDFLKAGADGITVHAEVPQDLHAILRTIKDAGAVPCVAVNPETPVSAIYPYLDEIGMALVMTVHPGFSGQKLIPQALSKVTELRKECTRRGINIDIEVDGGITKANIGSVAASGANVFVAGSAVYGSCDPAAAIECLCTEAEKQL